MPLQDAIWNYDARNYSSYLLRSGGVYDMQWVMQHTAILHFCGREKPWKPGSIHRFGILYQHYMQLARRGREICLQRAAAQSRQQPPGGCKICSFDASFIAQGSNFFLKLLPCFFMLIKS